MESEPPAAPAHMQLATALRQLQWACDEAAFAAGRDTLSAQQADEALRTLRLVEHMLTTHIASHTVVDAPQ